MGKENYEQISFRAQKGTKDMIKQWAEECNLSNVCLHRGDARKIRKNFEKVSLAYAGMILGWKSHAYVECCEPRMRGDDPDYIEWASSVSG